MSGGGKGGGLFNRLVISPFISLALIFTCCYFLLGGPMTASFAKTATTALGWGVGVTVGSLPNLASSLKDGQNATSGGTAPKAAAPKASSQPQAVR